MSLYQPIGEHTHFSGSDDSRAPSNSSDRIGKELSGFFCGSLAGLQAVEKFTFESAVTFGFFLKESGDLNLDLQAVLIRKIKKQI